MFKKIIFCINVFLFTICVWLSQPSLVSAKVPDSFSNLEQKMQLKDKYVKSKNILEKSYLGKNDNGTFFIKKGAQKAIDPVVLKQLKQGMNQINNLIINGYLESKKGFQVTETSKFKYKIYMMGVRSGSITNLGNIVWHSYGFDVCSNARQSLIMANILQACANDIKLGGIAGGVVGKLVSQPYGLIISVGSGITSYNFSKGAEQCRLGHQNGNGSITYFLGAPSRALFTHAQAVVYN